MQDGYACPKKDLCDKNHCTNPLHGFVKHDETLMRLIMSPHHISHGKISPAAFSEKDLCMRGLSTNRKRFFTANDAVKISQKIIGERDVTLAGCCAAKAIDIRGLQHNNETVCLICPSGTQNNHSHADIYVIGKFTYAEFNKLRVALKNLFSQFPIDCTEMLSS